MNLNFFRKTMTPNFCLGLYDPSKIRGRNTDAVRALAAPEYQEIYENLSNLSKERDLTERDILSISENLNSLQKEALHFCWPWIGTKRG